MWIKERWESRWRFMILNLIGWALAALFPWLFHLMPKSAPPQLPHALAPLLQYPHFAYGWFGEDLPELLLVYVVVLAIASIAREWQTGTIEFLAQMPLQRSRIALEKGLWGSFEIAFVAVVSSAIMWGLSILTGHHLPLAPYSLSVFVITVGFIAILWLVSACAWALHSTYSVIVVGVLIFAEGLVTGTVPTLKRFSLLTYVTNTAPYPPLAVLWEHAGIVVAAALGLMWLTLRVADRQEWIPHYGRDQM